MASRAPQLPPWRFSVRAIASPMCQSNGQTCGEQPHSPVAGWQPVFRHYLPDWNAVLAAEDLRARERVSVRCRGFLLRLTYLAEGRFTNFGALLFLSAVIVFMIGLVSEQITSLVFLHRKRD